MNRTSRVDEPVKAGLHVMMHHSIWKAREGQGRTVAMLADEKSRSGIFGGVYCILDWNRSRYR
jgi:hypothetical protein